MLKINDKIDLGRTYIHIKYVRSHGPGGQNVNKLNTQAQLTFELNDCTDLAPTVKKRLAQMVGRRLNAQGQIIIRSDRFRLQKQNRQQCLDRLKLLVQKALIPPKKRRPTKPSFASKKKRLDEKKRRSKIKSLRQKVSPEQ